MNAFVNFPSTHAGIILPTNLALYEETIRKKILLVNLIKILFRFFMKLK